MKTKRILYSFFLIGLISFFLVGFNKLPQKDWVSIPTQDKWIAPKSADKIVNPLKNDANASASGKKLFKVMCTVCHGIRGKGDGMAAAGLTPKPTDLTSDAVQAQTDGAIFWKIAEGRTPMASYKSSIPEKKRWEIINYIRTLK